ncbi:MAG TPA: carboxypeptidase regulatory-like domain-containing protein, partial [Cyclobacteriaceae bacterium]
MSALVCAVLLASVPFYSFAQSSAVSGTARDGVSRKPIEGAQIFLKSKSDSVQTTTDTQGHFTISDVKAGRYICSVQSLGFETDQQETLV